MRSKEKSIDVYELIQEVRKGNKKAEEKLVEINVNLIWSIINRLSEETLQKYEKEDLFQVGMIGLIKAIRKFEIDRELKFSTYAFPLILGEIKMFLREDGIVKVSRLIKDNAKKIYELKEKYFSDGKGDITLNDISIELNIPKSEVILAMNYKNDIVSLDDDNENEEKNNNIKSKIKSKENIEDEIINKTLIKEVMKKLSSIERKIIILRYVKEKKQKEVGEELNITQVKVSRLEKEALGKIKRMMV